MPAQLPIALTCGDPSGVGPEIIARWLSENPDLAPKVAPVGPEAWVNSLGIEGVVTPGQHSIFEPGKPTREGAKVAWDALKLAAAGCSEGRFSAVVTGPVGKEQLQDIGYPFPGQTEFFADAWGGVPSMAFAGKELKVVLATWHEPLSAIPGLLQKSPDLLDRAVIHAVEWIQREGIKEPRVAVCGLNPHAGEGGMLGMEERDLLNPRLEILRRLYPGVTDCLPADTVFHRMREKEFDAAVALYHDQGLIPVKTLEFHSAVNVTLGLDFVRTSPDHGTAFAIAGKGIARTGSFTQAVELAMRYAQMSSRVERNGESL